LTSSKTPLPLPKLFSINMGLLRKQNPAVPAAPATQNDAYVDNSYNNTSAGMYDDGYNGSSGAGMNETTMRPDWVDPNVYGDNAGATGQPVGHHHGNFRHDAEGAAAGGFAGHEYQEHHAGTGGPGVGTGAAAGAFAGHEYNKHHAYGQQNINTAVGADSGMAGVGAGSRANGGMGPAPIDTSVAPGNASGIYGPSVNSADNTTGHGPLAGIEAQKEARQLNRSGKMEKAMGTMLFSTTMKQKGLQKQAVAQNMLAQQEHLAAAENLEAQARLHRGHAAGLGAHPNHISPSSGGPIAGGTGAY